MNRVMFQLQRTPWSWPRQMQIWLWVCLFALSFIASCLSLGQGEVVEHLHATQVQHVQNLQSIQALQGKLSIAQQDLTRMAQTPEKKRDDALPNVIRQLKTSAAAFGLQLPVLTASQNMDAPHLSFEVHGRYDDVWSWWQRAQANSSALVLQQLSLHPEGDQFQMSGRWLWLPIGMPASDEQAHKGTKVKVQEQSQSFFPLPENKPHTGASHHIGFDQAAWLQAQRWHAQQLPSYAKWVMPEVNRKPQHLEQFELRHLRYEGMISDANKQQALVRILDGSITSPPLVLLEQGAYLGQDFGRLLSISPEHLWLREVVRDARGEWAPRWVKLPLGRLLEQAPSSKSAS
jgi:type IV pilus assembly protein PilP